jgi:hypothetical protein
MCTRKPSAVRVIRPHGGIAAVYDRSVGLPFFLRAGRAFETVVRRYEIRFVQRQIRFWHRALCLLTELLLRPPVHAMDRSTEMLRHRAVKTGSWLGARMEMRALLAPNFAQDIEDPRVTGATLAMA